MLRALEFQVRTTACLFIFNEVVYKQFSHVSPSPSTEWIFAACAAYAGTNGRVPYVKQQKQAFACQHDTLVFVICRMAELLYYIRSRIQQNIPDVMLRWQDQFLLHHR